MTTASSPSAAHRLLQRSAVAWFVAATLGQWLFVAFIVLFFGGHGLLGDPAALDAKPNLVGYVSGDHFGNAQFIGHALIGGLITFAGTWQLIPALRRRWPRLHRWNGRLFVLGAVVATLSGMFLTWTRGAQIGPGSNLSITLNGLLILAFAALALRSALRRDFTTHRRHALRLWLLVNGVWFLRIGIMLAGLTLAPLGIQLNASGAVFTAISFASWLLPLGVLELYLRAQRSPRSGFQYATAALLAVMALLTLIGSGAAGMLMWWPYL